MEDDTDPKVNLNSHPKSVNEDESTAPSIPSISKKANRVLRKTSMRCCQNGVIPERILKGL